MVFAPELNDEEQNMIGFLLGAALRALDRPGGYKEFQALGFGRTHVIRMLQKFGHDTDRLAKEHQARAAFKASFDVCICGHLAAMHPNKGACTQCMMCNSFWASKIGR